ncbi:MAG: MgtC/SapB family protein [Vulcanimicrobiota bacterium]
MQWPYADAIFRLVLALALGLFIGLERERRHKEAGVRTFAFAALLGGLGALLGEDFALASLALLGLMAVLLNISSLRDGHGAELTTTAAMLVTGYTGLLCGQGHTFTPVAIAMLSAGLLAWKNPLSGFSLGLTETELRSAILLGILAFVIYPALPTSTIDPWGAIDPRAAWVTVILIAGIGFVNYILLKLYGSRGFAISGFLGGLVNSSVTVSEMAARVQENEALGPTAYRAVLLATAAMLVRNAVILGLLSPLCLVKTVMPMVFMLLCCGGLSLWERSRPPAAMEAPVLDIDSPFSLFSALKFGVLFLVLEVLGETGQRHLGQFGLYGVSLLGGAVSSSSAVASAGLLVSHGSVSATLGANAAVVASVVSAMVNVPLVMRSGNKLLVRRLAAALVLLAIAAGLGVIVQARLRW